MRQKMKQLMGILLSLVLVLGLMPGMSLTAYAYDGNPYTSLVNTNTTVTFNGKTWYIIADNSTAVDAGTVTLLAADTSFGLSAFSDSYSNDYSSSSVKAALDAMTASGGSFADVADAIVTNTDAGGKLYLLSTDEAKSLQSDVLKINFTGTDDRMGGWWRRSPGSSGDEAACVFGKYGHVDGRGNDVDDELGVRPALKLNLSSVIFSSESGSYSFALKPSHIHNFTSSVSHATITATFSAADCPLTGSKSTLTLVKPTLTTYGGTGDATATLTGLTDFNAATGLNVAAADIEYYVVEEAEGGGFEPGDKLNQAPTDAGKYYACLTIIDEKIPERIVDTQVLYTIDKASPIITTAPTAGDTLDDSTLTGGTANVAGSFAWKDSTIAPTVSDSQTTEYDVVFTSTDVNYGTAECKVKLTVNNANSAVTNTPEAKTLTYNGQAQELVTAGEASGGEMQYALGTATEATQPYTTSIPAKTDAGT